MIRRVLLVDDDPAICESMQLALECRGFEVLIAQDGVSAWEICETQPPCLVILDQMIPRRSGLHLLEMIRASSRRQVPVIMITANEGPLQRAYAEQLGVTEYLVKPFSMDELIDLVELHAPLSRSRKELAFP